MNTLPTESAESQLPPAMQRPARSLFSLRSLLTCATTVALAILGLGLFVWLVVAPLFQETVDPNLGGPSITRQADPESQSQQALRGSITDLLVAERESPPEHPLDPALEVARLGLEKIRREIRDYTALMVKQERVKGKLLPEEFLRIKVRHADPKASVDRAFYVRHVKPQGLAGQEAIWIENRNNGKLVGHGAGIQRFIKLSLPPDGLLAMRNNRYPITELGIETLVVRMIEKGQRDRQYGECEVEYDRDLVIDGNRCTRITITHPVKRDHFEFFIAKIYIDDDLNLPVGYEGFDWPETEGGEPVLVESYFYRELRTNVGLKEIDFDPQNPDYDYP